MQGEYVHLFISKQMHGVKAFSCIFSDKKKQLNLFSRFHKMKSRTKIENYSFMEKMQTCWGLLHWLHVLVLDFILWAAEFQWNSARERKHARRLCFFFPKKCKPGEALSTPGKCSWSKKEKWFYEIQMYTHHWIGFFFKFSIFCFFLLKKANWTHMIKSRIKIELQLVHFFRRKNASLKNCVLNLFSNWVAFFLHKKMHRDDLHFLACFF